MQRLAINELTTFRWSFEEDVRHYADAGIGVLGVWRQKLSDYGEEKGAELLAEQGLAVSSLSWAGGFTGSEGRSFQESLEDGLEAVQLAASLKAGCLVVYSGARAGHTHNHARRLLKSALKEMEGLAGDLGVTLALEPMHPGCAAEWTFLTNIHSTLDLLSEIDRPHLKIVLDTYHVGDQENLLENIPQFIQQVALVHLGDAKEAPDGEQNRYPLGEGVLPLTEIVSALLASGYKGFFEIELMGEAIEASDYHELIARSKESFAGLAGAAL